MGGSISVASDPGAGTTFSVYLPAAAEVASQGAAATDTV
jgi:signal transduction histidine kinase